MARIGGHTDPSKRHPTDLYTTDPKWTEALLRAWTPTGPVWECAAGHGHITHVLEAHGLSVKETDITTGQDFLAQTDPWPGSIITNPPYSHFVEFVQVATRLSASVALLIPIDYLGAARRADPIWFPNPPALIVVIPERMKVNGQASQHPHIWCVWERGSVGTRLVWESVRAIANGIAIKISAQDQTISVPETVAGQI